MDKPFFDKPPLTYEEQIQLLKSRGLSIQDEEKALHILQVISYYRLSGYWFPLLVDKVNHKFKHNAEFETAFNLYKFDREFRLLILGELEKIEVAVRGQMIQQLSLKISPFWFEDETLFKSAYTHNKTIDKIREELKRSDEEFILKFKAKYQNEFPPSWMTLEITSFGSLSVLFSALKPCRAKRNIANYFGLDEKTFQSWLHSFVYLRNVCAHHSRLWNRDLRIKPQIPNKPKKQWLKNSDIENDKVYFQLSMILYLIQTINPKNSITSRFKSLLTKYPNIDVKAMGFPDNWEKESLWEQV
jgi:abortive infection bacteriophage resistance protein